MDIVVLGSGMGGFGASHRLHEEGIRAAVYEQSSYFGGHTASFRNPQGFLFDLGPHISFTKDARIQALFARAVDDRYEAVQVDLSNYWQGVRIPHPVQMHLHALPKELIVEIVADFVREQKTDRPVRNYEDWLVASYGQKFAALFPMTYTRKYHLTDAANMSTDWLGPRMYRPSIEELVRGSLGPWKPETHYIQHFRYPSSGGFLSYLAPLPSIASLHLDHKAVRIDPRQRQVAFACGQVTRYDALISSVPLPELVPMIAGTPPDVLAAAEQLACSTCVLVNIGVDRANLSSSQVVYFYDEDVTFTRLSFPHMLAASNAPAGHGSIQAEVYFSSKYRPLDRPPDALIAPVIDDLVRTGILRDSDRIVCRGTQVVPYANVIFDLERTDALRTVHGYLDDVGIDHCGRYGDWGYMWTDESFISGERAAERALARRAPERSARRRRAAAQA